MLRFSCVRGRAPSEESEKNSPSRKKQRREESSAIPVLELKLKVNRYYIAAARISQEPRRAAFIPEARFVAANQRREEREIPVAHFLAQSRDDQGIIELTFRFFVVGNQAYVYCSDHASLLPNYPVPINGVHHTKPSHFTQLFLKNSFALYGLNPPEGVRDHLPDDLDYEQRELLQKFPTFPSLLASRATGLGEWAQDTHQRRFDKIMKKLREGIEYNTQLPEIELGTPTRVDYETYFSGDFARVDGHAPCPLGCSEYDKMRDEVNTFLRRNGAELHYCATHSDEELLANSDELNKNWDRVIEQRKAHAMPPKKLIPCRTLSNRIR